MKKKITWVMILLLIILNGCGQQKRSIPPADTSQLQRAEALEQFKEITGYQAKGGKFYFTAMPEGNLSYYSFDFATGRLSLHFDQIQQFLSFIPLDHQRAVYVDMDNQLYYRRDNENIKLDEEISGLNSPNVLVSPDGKGVLYTKKDDSKHSLYRYMFEEGGRPEKVIDEMEEEAFNTFHFTTQWSNHSHYFIYYHQQVYDHRGKLVATLNGTTSKWSPDDRHIAFIKMPRNKDLNEITIGDWHTFVGRELILFDLENYTRTTLFREEEGFIDPIENIQWSHDGSRVAISQGEIIKTEEYFERLNYDKILVYDLKEDEKLILEPMDYNFYGFVFNNFIYGTNLGVKEPLALVSIKDNERRKYDDAIILNSKDMYFITHQDQAYMVRNKTLVEFNPQGEERELMKFPWEVFSVFLDDETNTMVIINRAGEVYLLKI